MMPSKALIDTTVLVDLLLKPNTAEQTQARQAVAKFKTTQLPAYAIKEFKAGALANYIYCHNKLAVTRSLSRTLKALQRLSLTPQRYKTATALEALSAVTSGDVQVSLRILSDEYGAQADVDYVNADRMRFALQMLILRAWKKRRHVTTEVILPLACYEETSPYEHRGLLERGPVECERKPCAMAAKMSATVEKLQLLRQVIAQLPAKTENQRRSQALRKLVRFSGKGFSSGDCRRLGDAVFAYVCPDDSVILTTNTRDMQPLASALGKIALSPSDV